MGELALRWAPKCEVDPEKGRDGEALGTHCVSLSEDWQL